MNSRKFLLSFVVAAFGACSVFAASPSQMDPKGYAVGEVAPTPVDDPSLTRNVEVAVSIRPHIHGMALDTATKKITPAPRDEKGATVVVVKRSHP